MAKKLTTTDVAKIMGVSDQSVANWIDQGLLKAGRTPGGHRRIEREDLVEFLRQQNLKIPPELGSAEPAILIVDDDEAVCRFLADAISSRRDDCRVLIATDGYSAGEIVTAENPDLVFLDLFMPGLNGFEVCRRIKNSPKTCHISVVAITAHPSEQTERDIIEAGAQRCLTKPIKLEQLHEVIDSILVYHG